MAKPFQPLRRFLHETVSTLKFKIIALSVLTGLTAALGAVQVAMDATIADVEQAVLDGEKVAAERHAALLGDKLSMLQAALRATAGDVPAAAWHDGAAMTRYLAGNPALSSLFDIVGAVDVHGDQLARLERGVPRGHLANIGAEPAFVRALSTDQPVVSKPLVSPVLQVPVVALLQPVVDGAGRHRGVLMGTLRLGSTALFSLDAPGHRGVHEMVIDRRGVLLSHPDRTQIMGDAEALDGLHEVVAAWKDIGAPIDTAAQGQRLLGRFVSLVGIPGSDWAVLRTTDESIVLRPVEDARRRGWKIALMFGVLSGVMAGILAWFASLPIARLREEVERLRANPALAAQWPSDNGEIGRLTQAFAALVAERAASEAESLERLRQLQAVMDQAHIGIALTQGAFVRQANAGMATIFGLSRERFVGAPLRLLHADDAQFERTAAAVRGALARAGAYEGELPMVRADGAPVWCRVRGRPVDAGAPAAGVIWTFEDITVERAEREELSWAASHDPLTGLVNRASFEVALEAACAGGPDTRFAALFIDLDRFKAVNDGGGHAAGDALLRAIAAILLAGVRHSDVVARVGGDEFAVLLTDCPQARAIRVGETVRRAVERYELAWEGQAYAVGASVGLVAVALEPVDPVRVMRAADAACYAAKRAGRNRIAVADLTATDETLRVL